MRRGEIVGRDEELDSLASFLDRTADELVAVVLEGRAGIGKSTLWLAGVEAARERGLRVLSSRPAEAERGLAHAGLGDLLENVLERVLPALSPPRRRALEAALLVEDAAEGSDPRTLGVAVRSALEALVAEEPVVLAVDDVQWLDPSSASALAFALRRMGEQPILLLLARRLSRGAAPSELERAIEADRVQRLPVGPLSLGAIHRLLEARFGHTFSRPALLRVHETSGGNPFYALELARAMPADVDPTQPLRVPDTLEGLVRARLDGLPPDTRQALLLASALGSPSAGLLADAGVTENALTPALAAYVIERADGTIRFTHPLLASVLYQGAPEEERRGAHRRLSAVVDDPVERARHLGLASDAPSDEIAATLEEAATRARARGTIVAAAELAEHALRLTPSEALEDQNRRTIAAARAHLDGGGGRRARTLAHELVARARAGWRAEALVLLSDIERASHVTERSIELRRQALEAAAGLPILQAQIHQWLAREVIWTEGAAAADEHAVIALELAEAIDDDSLRAGALAGLAFGRFMAGVPGALSLLDQAAQFPARPVDPRRRREVDEQVVVTLTWSYQLDRARALLESVDREWSDRDELTSALVHFGLATVELLSRRFPLAAHHAERLSEIERQYMIDDREDPTAAWLVALIAVHRGELERARALAQGNRQLTEGQPAYRSWDDAVLGLVELWSGRPGAAAALFAAADAERRGSGVNEPALFWWRADHAEALLELGRLDEAAALVDAWQADAARLGRDVVLAEARRCRGLVAAARGEIEEAVAELEQAVVQHEAAGDPFGRARALLALGIVRRRARKKRAARDAIEAALDGFETCGATGWSEKARAELGRIGGRSRIEGLTPAERRVAALVADGHTNREVAAALFLGERTVAGHLTHIYAKLGVRSRTELARRLR